MASRTDKFMYLDMEFYDSSSFGFVNFYNNAEEGENLAGGTIGFGDVEERRIGFYGTENVDIFEIKNFNDIEVHNYDKEDDEITAYHDSQFIVKADSFKFSLQNPNEVAVLNLHTDTLNNYIKIEEEKNEDDEIIVAEQKWDLNSPDGMLFSTNGTIGFVSGDKMVGAFNMTSGELTWVGEVYSKDYFNLDGVKVSYEGHIHNEHYTKNESDDRYLTEEEVVEEIGSRSAPEYKEQGYYRYNLTDNIWNRLEYILVDESYDIPDDAEDDTFWWAEKEQSLYEKRNGSLYTLSINDEVEIVDDLPAPVDEEVAYTLRYKRFYQYSESNNYWSRVSLSESEAPLVERDHKSNIDLSLAEEGDIFYITSTEKFYEFDGVELFEIKRPRFVYYENNNLPIQQSDNSVFEVKGGTFYMYNGSSWIEIDRPMNIPEIHYDNINKYSEDYKVVFVTRRK